MTETLGNPPAMTEYDEYLWAAASHHKAYLRMGAHLATMKGQKGTHFAVWAPNADEVSVIGDFNNWEHGRTPLHLRHATGVWQGFLPGVGHGDLYKYAVRPKFGGSTMEKADPYGFASELRPRTASRVWDLTRYQWNDAAWMAARPERDIRRGPLNVYEVHLGSWMRVPEEENRWLTYSELAPRLAAYANEMGYTHVEFMPVTEHPFDGSWGYQTVGYFAPTSRFGTPEEFMFLVDILHQHGVGVILDWVPAHFPTDGHALASFDGTCLYEHEDPRQGYHPHWGTFIFNYGRNEVRNFLISSAVFWMERYHIDGLRVDAVASMLYRDYGREGGDWIPNQYGGRENLEAVQFLKDFNVAVRTHFPGCFTLAEESTAWPRVTGAVEEGGLGFTFKWNMGWMNDTLKYFEKDPIYRQHHQRNLTFGMLYQYSEEFMLPLSHDEVVHGKRSLLDKMPGDNWQKRANLRVLMGYMMGYPGKKLMFMGGEFGQWNEWWEGTSLDWNLLDYPEHEGLKRWNADLNHLYRQEPALWELDGRPGGFEWIQCNDAQTSVVSFLRYPYGHHKVLAFVCNFTPVPRLEHRIGVPWGGVWKVRLSSDELIYGGSGVSPDAEIEAEVREWDGRTWSLPLTVPPLGLVILEGYPPAPPVQEQPPIPDHGGGERILLDEENR